MNQGASQAITLVELNQRLQSAIATAPGIHNVWVTAETSDMRRSGGHCYLELLQKHPDTGATQAKIRAAIWASRFAQLAINFRTATGTDLASGIKIMALVSTSFHPVYGLSLVINDINPEYTVGDLIRRRNEMLARLQAEGVLTMNRELPWPALVQRIAVVSAQGAAGYGDFINQLYRNQRQLLFHTELFQATLQGERAPASIIAALETIAARCDEFDCVVIIRGGGATSDLVSLDNYDLAANVAQFPLPIIVGVGHERDITILDYVANMRVKTPTAAAEWLIARGNAQLQRLQQLASEVYRLSVERISGNRRQLAYLEGQLAPLGNGLIVRHRQQLAHMAEQLPALVANRLDSARQRLDSIGQLVEALSPMATLRRGYTITRGPKGALKSATAVAPGQRLTTVFADGSASYLVFNLTKEPLP